jgi:hypothetical protein
MLSHSDLDLLFRQRDPTCAELTHARPTVRPYAVALTIDLLATDEIDAADVLSRALARIGPLAGITGARWGPEDVTEVAS